MPQKQKTKIKRFLSWAQKKVQLKDRNVLANLRRGFNTGEEHRAWPYLSPFCNLSDDRERIIWLTVAAGFATHETTRKTGNLGSTLRNLALKDSPFQPEKALKSFDARLRRLLACHGVVEVCRGLPGIIRAAKNKNDIPIDYEQLFADLWSWNNDGGERIKLEWTASYWRIRTP